MVHQFPGERNFHIFYQLLAGADEKTLNELSLQRNLDAYVYLSNGVCKSFKYLYLKRFICNFNNILLCYQNIDKRFCEYYQ